MQILVSFCVLSVIIHILLKYTTLKR
ncbi:MAG: hypothetical protein IAC78_03145 [Firmicutes bacterium]|uniref:Uncharacterized protein n=1 Tax=Candidatus Scatoplasma merdavium TaxID=2840932 RepID=A0A9D9DAD1_9BACL|nr:hypothetical protein [Candidatus Scatoplasma merdavium]